MDTIIISLLNIFLYPIDSYFVTLPCMFCFVIGLFSFIRMIIKGKF